MFPNPQGLWHLDLCQDPSTDELSIRMIASQWCSADHHMRLEGCVIPHSNVL